MIKKITQLFFMFIFLCISVTIFHSCVVPPKDNIENTSKLYSILRFERKIDPKNGKELFIDVTMWHLDNGIDITLEIDTDMIIPIAGENKGKPVLASRDRSIFTLQYGTSDEAEFYYEFDEENLALNLWESFTSKEDPLQQHPHIIITIDKWDENSISFTSETFWKPNEQIIKDGKYEATWTSYNDQKKKEWEEACEIEREKEEQEPKHHENYKEIE